MVNTLYPDAPRVAVGAVVVHDEKVLLVQRGRAPAQGLWAIPGGSVNLGETLQAAAEREVLEETGLRIRAGKIIYAFDAIQHDNDGRIQFHYVILDLEAEAVEPIHPLAPADDARDARWFSLPELNADDLPISETTRALLRDVMTKS